MTTIPGRTHSTAIGAGRERRPAPLGRADRLSSWLLVVAYGVACAVLLAGAAVVAAVLATALPGWVGVAAFFTVGVGLVAAAPAVARHLFERLLDARDRRELRRALPGRRAQ